MKKHPIALSYAKIQALYLLKIQAVETIRYLASDLNHEIIISLAGWDYFKDALSF